MKISPSPLPEIAKALPKSASVAKTSGKDFAAKLHKVRAGKTETTSGMAKVATPSRVTDVSDIGASLKSGRVTAEAAIQQVVERILARQLGAHAPAPIREKLEAALRESLTDDPLLASKVRALSGG